MPKEKQRFDVCPECKVREDDSSKKILYQCRYCKRWFCVKHLDPKLAVFKDFRSSIKDVRLREMVREDQKREDGHPDYAYTLQRLKEYDKEKEMDIRIRKAVLDRSTRKSKGCIIATVSGCDSFTLAFYEMIRDNFMGRTLIGRYLVGNYYRFSPYVIMTVLRFNVIKRAVKEMLTKLSEILQKKGSQRQLF